MWLDRERTLEKVVRWIDDAASQGSRLVAFGEALVEIIGHHHGGASIERRPNAAELLERIQPTDLVQLHDPQTAGLAPYLLDNCAALSWGPVVSL